MPSDLPDPSLLPPPPEATSASPRASSRPPSRKSRRIPTPTVFQMEATECGAAALGIILGHHHRFVPLEELRVACGVSRDGSKAGNVIKAARNYGLNGHGYKRDAAAVLVMEMPVIVFWADNHFLVVEGTRKNKVFLNDPALGPRPVSLKEFEQSYSGVVLNFTKTPEFRPGGSPPSMLASLRRRLAGSHGALLYVILAGLALVVPGLLIPIFAKIFVENYLVKGMDSWVRPLLFGMALTALMRAPLTWIQQHYLLRLETKLALSESGAFFWHILRLPVEFFSQRFSGEIGSRVAINDQVAGLLSGRVATTCVNVMMIVFYALLMLAYDVELTLIGIATILLNLAILRYISRKRTDESQRYVMENGKLTGVSMIGLTCIESVKSTGSESDFFAKWAGYQTKVVNASQNLAALSQPMVVGPAFLSSLNAMAILLFGAFKVMHGEMNVGMLVAFQSLMASFVAPVSDLVNLGGDLQQLQGNMRRLDDVIGNKKDPFLTCDPPPLPKADEPVRLSGALEFHNVTFGYNRLEPPLIENFNLILHPGDRVALVGPTGCGKSTLAKLVCGLYEPWEGQILYDGKPLHSIPREVFCNSVSAVDQDIFLFEGSIRENLTLWDSTLTDEQILRACRDAAIHAEVAARPGAYENRIDEGGGNFSGGQRQRLEIARALVRNPSVLVLDEATSALDSRTEAMIDQNLRRRGCTCLMVAHRLSTIRDCDEIIVLQDGRVVQRGSHAELSRQEGLYALLIAT